MQNTKVVATNVLTGILDHTVTDARGNYTFPNLAVGVYTINFSAPSFQSLDVTKVEIHVATTLREDATLFPGGVTTEVVVGATAPLLQAETSDIGQLVESSQITEIPLNGRDVYSLVTLTAGAQSNVAASGVATGATGSANTTTRPAISGGRAGFTVFRISGIEVNEQNLAGAFLVPSVDAVQEFRAVTQIQSASESGTSGVNVALKSGTNKFHGSAYEFLRNNVLDAQPYFQVTLPPTPGFKNIGNQLRYNQFGGAVGGPIWKNRTFFFVSIQATRQRTLSQVREVLPTSAELSGDFSDVDQLTGVSFAPVYDPTTKAPFPGNIIPQSRFSSFASKLLPIAFQSANCSACLTGGLGFDYVGNQPGATNDTQYLGEIEHHIGAKDTLAASRLYEPFVQPFIPDRKSVV